MLNLLSERPTEKRLKRYLLCGLILLTISTPAVIWTLEASNYPGGLEETQLGFDGEYIRDCLNTMTEGEITFFILGNLFDYIFMVSYGLLLSSASLFLSRRLPHQKLRKVGNVVSIIGVIAALSDAAENIFIISMAANPQHFPGWLVIPHSLFAHLKFNLMYISAGWIALAVLLLSINWILGKTALQVLTLQKVKNH
jgi:hypothetical protein